MSNDPSSIPNFGGKPIGPDQPDQPDQQDEGWSTVLVPDLDMVKQLLDQLDLKYAVDEDGDVVAAWESFHTYFMFRGDENENELFTVRTFYDQPYSIERKPALLEVVDEWNRITLWPKVYTITHDDGVVRLVGEAQIVVSEGVTLGHFVAVTTGWMRAAIDFESWLEEHIGLEDPTDDD